MIETKTLSYFAITAIFIHLCSMPVNVVASDNHKNLQQRELLSKLYRQENTRLESKTQELDTRVSATNLINDSTHPFVGTPGNTAAAVVDPRGEDTPSKIAVPPATGYKTKFPNIDDETICKYASYLTGTTGRYEREWSVSPVVKRYVDDAKKRGLKCGVGEEVVNKPNRMTEEKNNEPNVNKSVLPINFGLPAIDYSFIEGREASNASRDYKNRTAYYETKWRENYNDFPFYEIICRVVFEAKWVGLNNLEEIKSYLKNNGCTKAGLRDDRYFLSDMVQSGVRVDFDGDGVRDLLVFLYGWQVNNPLRMVAFKYKWETNRISAESPIERLFSPEEVFASGNYPKVQNARFISTADFNSDGKVDIF